MPTHRSHTLVSTQDIEQTKAYKEYACLTALTEQNWAERYLQL